MYAKGALESYIWLGNIKLMTGFILIVTGQIAARVEMSSLVAGDTSTLSAMLDFGSIFGSICKRILSLEKALMYYLKAGSPPRDDGRCPTR